MNRFIIRACCVAAVLTVAFNAFGQVTYTANTTVPAYTGAFAYGSNMGYYPPFSDEQIADITGGNAALNIPGLGVHSLRPALPEHFLEYWGYDIRLSTFQYYTNQGFKDNTVFIGYPSEAHRDQTQYCPGTPSSLFANMYEPIWDGGANGTPVNDNNYYALYLYRMVTLYKDHVKFWEVWNEPDFDYQGNGWKPADVDPANNWWYNNPKPCETALQAPVYHYIRMLRISYEVIKTISPSSYVAVGGIGYPSFLDVLLRNTDNPADGTVSSAHPLKGGAYFDALSYHSYPHIDGSMRTWSNAINGFVYNRHSDAAVDGLIKRKGDFDAVLSKFNYNGTTYPSKVWLVTENNIPRYQAQDFLGSDAAQRNYIGKALVMAQKNNIGQFYVYCPADLANDGQSTNEFDFMGLYKKPDGSGNPATLIRNSEGTAHKSMSDLMYNWKYDATQTQSMALPTGVRGAAFKSAAGGFNYILWAATTIDQSETASAAYTFPASFGITSLNVRKWDYFQSKQTTTVSPTNVALTGTPIILTPMLSSASLSVTPETQAVSAAAGTFPVSVNTNIAWTVVSSNTTWLTVSPTSGTGSQTVTATYKANTGSTSRTATLTFSGGGISRTVTVTQSGATLSVSPTTLTASSSSQTAAINVSATGSWTVSENAAWITLASASGVGNGSFSINISANTKTTTRSAKITVKSGTLTATVTVSQAGKSANRLSVSPAVINFNTDRNTSRISVSANTEWIATTDANWLQLFNPNHPNPLLTGEPEGMLRFEALSNPGTQRVGTIYFTGSGITRIVKIIQAGKSAFNGDVEERGGETTLEEMALHVFPNPVTGQQMQVQVMHTEAPVNIELFDCAGRVLAAETVYPGETATLQTGALPTGLYLICAKGDKKTITTKVAVMR